MLTCMSSTILFLLPSLCLSAVIHKTSMSVESTGGVHKWMESEEHGTNEHDLVSVEVGGGAVSHSSDDGKYAEAVGGDSAGELPPGAPRLPPGATDYRDGRTYEQVVVNDPRDEVPPNEKQRPNKKQQGLPYPPLPDGAVDHRDGRTYKQVVVDDKRGAPTGAPATKRRAEPEPKSKPSQMPEKKTQGLKVDVTTDGDGNPGGPPAPRGEPRRNEILSEQASAAPVNCEKIPVRGGVCSAQDGCRKAEKIEYAAYKKQAVKDFREGHETIVTGPFEGYRTCQRRKKCPKPCLPDDFSADVPQPLAPVRQPASLDPDGESNSDVPQPLAPVRQPASLDPDGEPDAKGAAPEKKKRPTPLDVGDGDGAPAGPPAPRRKPPAKFTSERPSAAPVDCGRIPVGGDRSCATPPCTTEWGYCWEQTKVCRKANRQEMKDYKKKIQAAKPSTNMGKVWRPCCSCTTPECTDAICG